MGGRGSGRRRQKAGLVEDCFSLDLEALRRKGLDLRERNSGAATWTRWDQTAGSVGFTVEPGGEEECGIRLRYRASVAGREPRDVDLLVNLETTLPGFGGVRWWWSCPACGRRCRILYAGGESFACRLCYRLTYRSAQRHDARRNRLRRLGERDLWRLARQGNDLALGALGDLWERECRAIGRMASRLVRPGSAAPPASGPEP